MTETPTWYAQTEYNIRCEWGLHGVRTLAPISDVVVIVDVLSFTTSVSVAVERGAFIYPYAGPREDVAAFAAARNAEVAGHRDSGTGYSLSPHSLVHIPAGTRLVLPSPNGSTLSTSTGDTPTLAGCLRNARAVADAAQQLGRRIAIIPAGERWRTDGSLRPCFEDLVGAGSIISGLSGPRSPEALAAEAAFVHAEAHLLRLLRGCGSGRELIERGTPADVDLAAALNASDCAPLLQDGAYRNAG
jgi:2-phosphosulfolactate phosphatase